MCNATVDGFIYRSKSSMSSRVPCVTSSESSTKWHLEAHQACYKAD